MMFKWKGSVPIYVPPKKPQYGYLRTFVTPLRQTVSSRWQTERDIVMFELNSAFLVILVGKCQMGSFHSKTWKFFENKQFIYCLYCMQSE